MAAPLQAALVQKCERRRVTDPSPRDSRLCLLNVYDTFSMARSSALFNKSGKDARETRTLSARQNRSSERATESAGCRRPGVTRHLLAREQNGLPVTFSSHIPQLLLCVCARVRVPVRVRVERALHA